MYAKWSEEFEVGVPMFDEQHKMLFSLINMLHIAQKGENSNRVLENLLNALEWYVEVHFQAEEEEMEKNEYPHYKEHKNEHEELKRKVYEYHQEFLRGKDILNDEFFSFLNNWLTNHIAVSDKKYEPFMKSK